MFKIRKSNFISSPGAACSSSDDDLSLSLSEGLTPKTPALPPEILKNIFSFLTIPELETAREVSKFWRDCADVALSEKYRKQRLLAYSLKDSTVPGSHLKNVAKANPLLKRLAVIHCDSISSYDFTQTFSHLSNLRGVTLSGKNAYSRDPIKKLGEGNPLMKHLSITDESLSSENDRGPILAILNSFKELHSLHLHLPNKAFSESDLSLFSKYLPSTLKSFTFISASGWESAHLLSIAERLKHLQKCRLSLAPSLNSKSVKKIIPIECEFVAVKQPKIKK